jgi:hypothetical protein
MTKELMIGRQSKKKKLEMNAGGKMEGGEEMKGRKKLKDE